MFPKGAAALLVVVGLSVLVDRHAHAQDADTIQVGGTTYRLDGIDAPESDQFCLDQEGKTYRCGRDAAEVLKTFIAGRTIQCDNLGPDRAYPKRSIGQCSVDGVDLHQWLVKEGWAINFEPHAEGRFKSVQEEARQGRFGMWKGCFVAPQDYRRWNRGTAALLGVGCPDDAREKLFPDDPEMPPGCQIKGKYSWRAYPYLGIYHEPGCGSYVRTKKPSRWFCGAEEAQAAGFRRSFTCWW